MDENSADKYFSQEEQLEKIKAERLKLRMKIKEILEEETGRDLSLEEDLTVILNALPPEQQQTVHGKILLAQKFL